MSTIVYQEVLQSNCYESHIVEPRTLSLKLTSTNSTRSTTPCNTKGWGAIEFLPSSSNTITQAEYVHPLAKRKSSMLSDKSLEMCTESLGNETGTCMSIDDSGLFFSSSPRRPAQKRSNIKAMDVNINSIKFPPPLTTMSGSNSIQVRPYREDGRLVIEAVSAPPTKSCLQAERSDGRLRLSMVRHCSSSDYVDDEESHEESHEESPSDDQVSNVESNEVELCVVYDDDVEEEDEQKEEEETRDVVEVEEDVIRDEKGGLVQQHFGEDNMSGIKLEFGVKMGMGEFHQRPRRCKEAGMGNNRLINWEAFWVAT